MEAVPLGRPQKPPRRCGLKGKEGRITGRRSLDQNLKFSPVLMAWLM